ncbi:MAG: RES family NAD+ phosphorylase [Desulfobacteraceae bacterium]|nr:RES family NAD+ phosphorylase [Desulfobacteraceae bacterium]
MTAYSGKIYYRARIHKNRNRVKRFLPKELGAPEPEYTNAGRGNEKGQPVLYLASDDKTAISEVRPWKDSSVAVGEAQLLKNINLISLIDYIIPESPFFQDNLYWPIWVGGLFHRLAEELSKPVMPNEEEIFYKPTQYLCEQSKKLGYDGIIYPSGLGPGNNIILFDPKIAKITFVSYVRINDINFLTDPINENEVLYEETMYDHFLK